MKQLAVDLNRIDFRHIQYDEIFMRLPENELTEEGAPDGDEVEKQAPQPLKKPAAQVEYKRQIFLKYI